MNKIKLAAAAAISMLTVGLTVPAQANTKTAGCTYQGEILGDVTEFVGPYNTSRAQNGHPVAETAGQLAEYVVAVMVTRPQYQENIPVECRDEAIMTAAMIRQNNWQPNTPVGELTGTITLPASAQYVAPTTVSEPVVQPVPGAETIDPPEAELLEEQAEAQAEREVIAAEQAAVTSEIASLRQQIRAQARHSHAPNPVLTRRLSQLEGRSGDLNTRLDAINTRLDGLESSLATYAKADNVYSRTEMDEKLAGLSLGLPIWLWLIIVIVGLLALIALVRTFMLKTQIDNKADTSSIPDVSKKADTTDVEEVDGRLKQLANQVEDLSDQVGHKSITLVGGWKATAQALKAGEEAVIQVDADGDKYLIGLIGTDGDNEVSITSGVQGQPETNVVKVEHLRRILRKAAYQDRLTEKIS